MKVQIRTSLAVAAVASLTFSPMAFGQLSNVREQAEQAGADIEAAGAAVEEQVMGAAVAIPAQAVSADTAMAIYADAQAIRADDIRSSVKMLMNAMGEAAEADIEEMNSDLDEFKEFRDKFIAAGGKGLLALVEVDPATMEQEEPTPTILLHVKPGTDPAAIAALIKETSEGDADPEVAVYADGWLSVSDEDIVPAGKHDGTGADQIQAALSTNSQYPARAVFMITPKLRAEMKRGIQEAQQNGADAMAANLMATVEPLQTVTMGLKFGNDPMLAAGMNFPTEAEAGDFNDAYTGALAMVKQMSVQQVEQMQGQNPDMPAPQEVRDLFDALKMKQDGSSLSLTIDGKTMASGAKVAAPMVMMMMMGGMGGGF